MSLDFSVVISVYSGDNSILFKQAVLSVLNQTLEPKEIIVTVDGVVGAELNSVISDMEVLPTIRVLYIDKNVGLGASRHMAIKSANTGIIAVMDSDDISDTNRFFQQISYFEKYDIDLVGGYISEFNPKSEHCTTVRKVPLIHQDIIKRGRWFSPINHVTVMFRKEAYFKTGGYGSLRMVEDYDLFHRMVLANLKFANIPKVLVYVSASDDQYMRRHGLAYFLEEWGLMKRMLSSNYIGLLIFMINVNIRFLYRLIPVYFLKLITQNIFRSRMR